MNHTLAFFSFVIITTFIGCAIFSKKGDAKSKVLPGSPVFDAKPVVNGKGEDTQAYTSGPLPDGYDKLTLSMARGGNAGYMHPDPYWRGGWYGLNLD